MGKKVFGRVDLGLWSHLQFRRQTDFQLEIAELEGARGLVRGEKS